MANTERAQNVCRACMLRKKACDKGLPACGFCSSRRLHCRYHVSAATSKGRRKYNPGRHFVALESPESELDDRHPISNSSPETFPQQSMDESLNQLAQHFTQLTKLTYENIIDRYFESCHKWLPVVSPDSFRQEALRYQEERCLPAAEFSVLLLAMLLLIIPTLDLSVRPPRVSQKLLYTATKSALSQVQTSICTSLRLVQAAVLIALREYTCIRPEAAYVSMMTCVGMVRVVGIGTSLMRTTSDAAKTSEPRVEDTERENLTWSIALLERYEFTQTKCYGKITEIPCQTYTV
jgi:hypothetical protein